ncbi:hypothetical protein PL9631_810027 [Planktothrix paucivesiculata PCC 9631]|uniref:Uncharacterized protein n=1 Tax=Planktothrix paucivesiculata PCC 9631 TaxID=671071 RepID=A0A7Z9BXG0_9CYAN|nr:hypothetical protein PL9631_810027 [Planktothrix paucivesiculata PCC 9631]
MIPSPNQFYQKGEPEDSHQKERWCREDVNDTINKNMAHLGQCLKLQAMGSDDESTTEKTESPESRICQSDRNSSRIPDRYSPHGQPPHHTTETPNRRYKPSANTEKPGL